MNRLPILKTENIVMQETGAEILLYDTKTNRAYALNQTATLVYRACSERLTFDQLKAQANLTDEIIYFSLSQMSDAGLLTEKIESKDKFSAMTRRDVIKRAALGSAVALPLVSQFFIPQAINAASNFANPACGGSNVARACPRIDCDECCDGGLYDIIIVDRCPVCRCLTA